MKIALVVAAALACAATAACAGHASTAPDPAEPQAAPGDSAAATPVGPAGSDEATPAGPDESTAVGPEGAAPVGPEGAAPAAAPAAAPPSPAAAAAPDGCVVKISMDAKRVRFEGGGTNGGVPLRHLDKLKAALAPAAAAHCSAEISADAHVRYGDLVQVMDQLKAAGIRDMALASAAEGSSAPGSAQAQPGASPSSLSDDPLVVVTIHDVVVNGASLHTRPSAPGLQSAVQKALAAGRAQHPGGAVIIEADKNAPHAAVVHIVDAARDAGYRNVLFAVKKK